MVERLVLLSSITRFSWASDYPHSRKVEQIHRYTAATWGTPGATHLFAPSRIGDIAFEEALACCEGQSSSPSAIKRLHATNDQMDVRAILLPVRRPTVIIHRRRDRAVKVANGPYFADNLPEAEYRELRGNALLRPLSQRRALTSAGWPRCYSLTSSARPTGGAFG